MRILIVEDQKHLADALSEVLKNEKYFTDTIYNGNDGYEFAKSGIYDCIILDCMLPGMNGIDIIKRLRANKTMTPILMLTAMDTIEDKVRGLDAGADDYMTKPFSMEELLSRLRALTRRKGEIIPNEMKVGNTVFSSDTSELFSENNDKRIHLSFKEAEITKILFSSPGIIISKDVLITKVWGYDSDTLDNNVEAYISFIRRKLCFIESDCQITSVKKLGYKIEVK